MRELKFRAWHNGNYWPIASIDFEPNGDIINIRIPYQVDEYGNVDFNNGDINDVIIEQYTGLKDKNGKEIYEGDIVVLTDDPDCIYIECIVFENGMFCIGFDTFVPLFDYGMSYIEIIGNINEEPELLEGDDVL